MNLHVISHPEFFEGELEAVCQILSQNSVIFHLRKPDAKPNEFDAFMASIPKALHYKIILHDAYELARKYEVGGLHFSTKKRALAKNYHHNISISTSCHSLDEVRAIQGEFDSCFLSPIFPSISKKGYAGNLDLIEVTQFLKTNRAIQVIALAGIDETKLASVQQMGFNGAAVLGTVWGENPNGQNDFSAKVKTLNQPIERPYCLSIAGFDPSAGAGVLADIKTFEHNFCYGLGVNTALTYQNDAAFEGVRWIGIDEIKAQLKPLVKYPVKAIKIGLIEHFEALQQIILFCKANFPQAKIIWDPILKASAGFSFHEEPLLNQFLNQNIDLITPNAMEFNALGLTKHAFKNAILLKGGHRKDKTGCDSLFINHHEIIIEGTAFNNKIDKHGTGCVLSSAIAAHLAKGEKLEFACRKAKTYVEHFIQSNQTGLGYHHLV